MTGTSWRIGTGLAILVVYGLVALRLSAPPIRPMFEGQGAPQYNWVNPPPQFAPTNKRPEAAAKDLPLAARGSAADVVTTGDGQASAIFREGAFPARPRETAVAVRIDPIDPASVAPPPKGYFHDGNAYRVTAMYQRSGIQALPRTPVTIVLQYAIHATKLLRRDATVWSSLNGTLATTSLQIFGTSSTLGVFVADRPPLGSIGPKPFPAAIVISVGAAIAAVVAGLIARYGSRRRRSSG